MTLIDARADSGLVPVEAAASAADVIRLARAAAALRRRWLAPRPEAAAPAVDRPSVTRGTARPRPAPEVSRLEAEIRAVAAFEGHDEAWLKTAPDAAVPRRVVAARAVVLHGLSAVVVAEALGLARGDVVDACALWFSLDAERDGALRHSLGLSLQAFGDWNEAVPPEPRRPRVEDIQRAVARRFNLRRSELISERRAKHIVLPRQIAMYLAKVLTLCSMPEIGRRFGGRDHTTVLHAVRKIEGLVAADAALAAEVTAIEREIGG